MKYVPMNDKQFADASTFFTSKAASQFSDDYFTFLIECAVRYVEHAEVSHINTMLKAARSTKMNVIRVTQAMQHVVAVHKVNSKGIYSGKVTGKNAQKLAKLRADTAKFITKLEGIVVEYQSVKTAAAEEKAFNPEQSEKSITNLILRELRKGLGDEELARAYHNAKTQWASEQADSVTTPVLQAVS